MTDARPRVLVVQHEDDAGLGRWRTAWAPRAGVEVVRPDHGDPVPLDAAGEGYDAVVVLGGEMAAWEDDRAPWLPDTRRLIAAAVDAGTPLLGVCLGAQLLGMACGGTVERGHAGLEAGVIDVSLTPEAAHDPLLAGLAAAGASFPAVAWHGDAVTTLPPGAVLLATGGVYPHQAFRVGARAWGVQYHPEVAQDDVARWAAASGYALLAAGRDPTATVAGVQAREADLRRVARAHADAFLDLVATQPSGDR